MNEYRKALKNYTTKVSAKKMIQDIQSIILDFGGTGIIFDFDNERKIKNLLFKIIIKDSTHLINIPFMVEKTKGVLIKQKVLKEPKSWVKNFGKTSLYNDDQAYRVTLANIRDWLDAQLAIYSTEMFEFPQIFLPYMQTPSGRSVYEILKDKNFTLGIDNQL